MRFRFAKRDSCLSSFQEKGRVFAKTTRPTTDQTSGLLRVSGGKENGRLVTALVILSDVLDPHAIGNLETLLFGSRGQLVLEEAGGADRVNVALHHAFDVAVHGFDGEVRRVLFLALVAAFLHDDGEIAGVGDLADEEVSDLTLPIEEGVLFAAVADETGLGGGSGERGLLGHGRHCLFPGCGFRGWTPG